MAQDACHNKRILFMNENNRFFQREREIHLHAMFVIEFSYFSFIIFVMSDINIFGERNIFFLKRG